jgi:hypothetical protein
MTSFRKWIPLLLLILLVSLTSGILMSRPSLSGRLGINLVYTEYKFLRTWWKGALAVMLVLSIFTIAQGLAQARMPQRRAALVHGLMILLAITGLYFTWSDFTNTTTHRWLGSRFHIGAYLFWLGWIAISIIFLSWYKDDQLALKINEQKLP